MANPQLEKGRTEIANELTEALAKAYLNPGESRVLWAILRKTYGWHKPMDRISYTQFEKLTGMNRRHVADSLNRLISRKIITRRGNNYALEYGLQKNYEIWESLPVEATNRLKNFKSLPIEATKQIITHRGNTPLPVEATKSLPIEANTKAHKATIQKQEEKQPTFEQYKEKLRAEYQDIDFDNELEKFELYWAEGGRKLKRPKLALKNWMDKAREYKKRGNGDGTHRHSVRTIPKAHEYKQPDEY